MKKILIILAAAFAAITLCSAALSGQKGAIEELTVTCGSRTLHLPSEAFSQAWSLIPTVENAAVLDDMKAVAASLRRLSPGEGKSVEGVQFLYEGPVQAGAVPSERWRISYRGGVVTLTCRSLPDLLLFRMEE